MQRKKQPCGLRNCGISLLCRLRAAFYILPLPVLSSSRPGMKAIPALPFRHAVSYDQKRYIIRKFFMHGTIENLSRASVQKVGNLVAAIQNTPPTSEIRFIFVTGAPGSGKTYLTDALAGRAKFSMDALFRHPSSVRTEQRKLASALPEGPQRDEALLKVDHYKSLTDQMRVAAALTTLRQTGSLSIRNGYNQSAGGTMTLNADIAVTAGKPTDVIVEGESVFHLKQAGLLRPHDIIICLDIPRAELERRRAIRNEARTENKKTPEEMAQLDRLLSIKWVRYCAEFMPAANPVMLTAQEATLFDSLMRGETAVITVLPRRQRIVRQARDLLWRGLRGSQLG
jgi:hypothetical protein